MFSGEFRTSAAGLFEGGSAVALFPLEAANTVGTAAGPVPRQELPVVGLARQQALQNVVDAGLDVQIVAMGSADQCREGSDQPVA